jgi:hypothetical protein
MPLAVHFTDTITLGAALIAFMVGLAALIRIALGIGLRSTNEILKARVEALEGDVEDRTRRLRDLSHRLNELGAEKDAAMAGKAACEATVEALQEQIEHMPKYQDVIAFGTAQMDKVNEAAAKRQETFVEVVVTELKKHDEHVERIHQDSERRATERHQQQTEINHAILKALSLLQKEKP